MNKTNIVIDYKCRKAITTVTRRTPPDGVDVVYFLFVTRDKAVTTPWPRAQFALKTLVSRVT